MKYYYGYLNLNVFFLFYNKENIKYNQICNIYVIYYGDIRIIYFKLYWFLYIYMG